ncbi:MAG: lytic transglycosylase domain-containing protein [Arenicellales bacterium]
MKNKLLSAFGVPGFYSIVLLAIAASIPATTVLGGAAAKAAIRAPSGATPGPHPVSPMIPRETQTADDPVARRRRPKFWTVSTPYDGLIKSVAKRHDVDPALVKAIVQAESAFNPDAVSSSGARGLMQVLPETASRFSVHDLADPRQNLKAGVMYLKHLIRLFDGNVVMAVAAYNAGPNQVRRHGGVPPYRETRRYLNKVLGLRQAYADQLRRS